MVWCPWLFARRWFLKSATLQIFRDASHLWCWLYPQEYSEQNIHRSLRWWMKQHAENEHLQASFARSAHTTDAANNFMWPIIQMLVVSILFWYTFLRSRAVIREIKLFINRPLVSLNDLIIRGAKEVIVFYLWWTFICIQSRFRVNGSVYVEQQNATRTVTLQNLQMAVRTNLQACKELV